MIAAADAAASTTEGRFERKLVSEILALTSDIEEQILKSKHTIKHKTNRNELMYR